jgi:predicted Zn-dependent peptidase
MAFSLAMAAMGPVAAAQGNKPTGAHPPARPTSPAAPRPQPPGDHPRPAAPAAPAKPVELKLDVQKLTLDNGLRVVLSVDHTSPTIAVDVVYDVGGRNEERGHAGFAHLFEHMMFQGSANVPRGEHFKLVTSHGGQLNGSTSEDRTNYFEMMPRSELPLALWLEADRLKSLDVSEKNFENQRKVVEEEYRMRVENAAYVPASFRLEELVYQGYWPYEHPAIGNMHDLDAAQLEWVRAFHDAYYAPNNAVVSISGDFEVDEAKSLVQRFFGSARRHAIPAYEPGPIPEQTQPRDAVVEDAHAKLPALMYGWAIPPTKDPDHYALELAAMLLAGGESSRLYQQLVRERSLAIEVDADTDRHRGPDAFEIVAKLSGGGSIPVVARLIDEQIARLAKVAPSEGDMTKLRNQMQAGYVLGLQSNFARAQKLAEFELYRGDANLINIELGRYLSVTGEEIRHAVAKYLTKARRSSVEVKPLSDEERPHEAAPKAPGRATAAPKTQPAPAKK